MTIYLTQHGKANSKDVDPKRGLTEEGIAETEKVARFLKNSGTQIDAIVHSGKERAMQTAQIFERIIKPANALSTLTNMNPLDETNDFLEIATKKENSLFVGHLPFMEKLVGLIVYGDKNRKVVEFKNSGVAALGYYNNNWFIRWFITPEIL